ncbi:SpaA isopeptide-forming pilin-related protein, partial [uncultured Dubosiella sp.]|uniref:SpaA isopeptide-forming pilin-related protein n=4 Tax=uncultured Dubosiella sp. TaxID=1937011 RepID=UPI0025B59633
MKKTNKKRSWKQIVSILSCIVVFCTTYALILPAVTMSKETYCGKEEHTHTENCYVSETPLCGKEEAEASEGHVHDETCYEEVRNLICGLEESETHIHTDECYETTTTQTCGKEESEPTEGHTHSDECYKSEELQCGKEEHEHTRICESNKEDVEDPADWEKAYKELANEEDAKTRILTVAKNELGTKENKNNFEVDEEKEHYYTRYGHLYEDQYGDWNNYFTGYVLKYANVQMSYDKDASKWQNKTIHDQKEEGEEGNVVFFRNDEGELRTGIVTSIDDLKKEIRVIEGDVEGEVKEERINKDKVIAYLNDQIEIMEEDTPLAGEELEKKEDKTQEVDEENLDSSQKKVTIEGLDQPVEVGKQITVKASQSGFNENEILTYQWQYNASEDCDDDQWKDVAGETNSEFTIDVTEENLNYYWRVLVEKVESQTPSVPENASYKLKLNLYFLENADLGNETGEETNDVSQNDESEVTQVASSPFQLAVARDLSTVEVKYTLNSPSNLDTQFKPEPSVGGETTTYVENGITGENLTNYYVRVPNPMDCYQTITNGNSSSGIAYRFGGWKIKNGQSSGEIISAGTNIDLNRYISRNNDQLQLEGVWEGEKDTTVRFYVNLVLGTYDDYNSEKDVHDSNFMDGVYTTSLKITKDLDQKESQNITLYNWDNRTKNAVYLAYHTGNSKYSDKTVVDNAIRNLTTVTRLDLLENKKNTDSINVKHPQMAYFQLSSFPSDELIFERMRQLQDDPRTPDNKKIKENGKNVLSKEITAENFTIHWYVFKGSNDGNWHIDGTLVRREGQLTVTKTFAGNDEAIQKAKKYFNITVSNQSNSNIQQTLKLGEAQDVDNTLTGDQSNTISPVKVSEDENTYTWVVPVKAGKEYNVKENNYTTSMEEMNTVAQYAITNSGVTGENARLMYDGGNIVITGKNYSADIPYSSYETVNFFNTYIPSNELLITKVGDFGVGMEGIQFKISKSDLETPLKIYQNSVTGVYSFHTEGESYTEVEYLTTDRNGFIRFSGLKTEEVAGTYILKEIVPEGYEPMPDIQLEVDENGKITLKGDYNNKVVLDEKNLMIRNTSQKIKLTVTKKWSGEVTLTKDVTVRLVRNGQPVEGEEYEVKLDNDNSWTHTWTNLPSHRGGEVIQYGVLETWIGNTAYDPSADSTDGYEKYNVSYSDVIKDGDTYKAQVTNTYVDTGFIFHKTNDNGFNLLKGAEFKLYQDEQCTQDTGLNQIASDEAGIIKFPTLALNQVYYMKEIKAPEGYKLSPTIYKVQRTVNGTKITLLDGTPIGNAIHNNLKKATLVVKKIDNQGGKPLAGAEFELTKANDSDFKITLVSDDDGEIKFEDLTDGTYMLKETKAPNGYNLLTKTYTFKVEKGEITFEGTESDFTQEGVLEVKNSQGEQLPQTGGAGTQLFTFSGGAIIAASSLMYG